MMAAPESFGHLLDPLSSRHGEGRAACHLLPAALVEETMNSEVALEVPTSLI